MTNEGLMDLTIIFTGIGTVITIIGSMYGMLKFMLKDMHKEVELLHKSQQEFKEEMRVVHRKFEHIDNRLDGLYRVLLDRTYGKNIPEELK